MADPIDKPRQSCVKRPTAKLTDVNNLQQPALSFQQAAVEAERARLQLEEATAHPSPVLPSSSPPATSSCEVHTFEEEEIFLDQDVDAMSESDIANELSWEELWLVDPNDIAESDTEVIDSV